MKAQNISKAIVAVGFIVMASLGFWVALRPKAMVSHMVTVIDVSDSFPRDCEVEAELAQAAMERPQGLRVATFSLMRTGDVQTSFEPQLILSKDVPAAPTQTPLSGAKKASLVRQQYLASVRAACAALPLTKQSPLVRAVRRALEHLRSRQCGPQSDCVMVVHSDLQDNQELTVSARQIAHLDNTGIRVVLCGYAGGIQDRSSLSIDAAMSAWKSLFAAPVTFSPFCGAWVLGPSANRVMTQPNASYQSPSVDLKRRLLSFSPLDALTLGASFEGTAVFGSPGSGKTSGFAKNLAYALLRTPMMGGLVLCAKPEEPRQWLEYAKACGREKDVLLFNASSGHAFDPLFYEWNRPGRGAGDTEAIIDLFSTLLSVGKTNAGVSTERFWELAAQQLMRNVLVILALSGEPVSIANMHRVIQSLPTRAGEFEEPGWQAESYCGQLIQSIREREDSLTPQQWSDLDVATQYAFKRWPNLDERPRSSIEMTWAGMADKFLFQPLNRLFSGGKVTFVPELTTHAGKLLIVDFPILEYGQETGRLINVLMKCAFQRAWLRRDLRQSANPVFLWQDEFQYFISRADNAFQQTCRSARVAVVCITQNILNLAEELGETQPGSKTKAFLGNLMLKVFHQQNDPDTNQYAADLIGRQYRYLDSFNTDVRGGGSVGASQQLAYTVEPSAFTELSKPDSVNPISTAIVYQGGQAFQSTVTKENPKGRNHLTVAFSRDI
ncbi:MAG: type IV secretory system conjugative DNA transfer family protein [Acidobacteriota bacterium]